MVVYRNSEAGWLGFMIVGTYLSGLAVEISLTRGEHHVSLAWNA